MRDASLFRERFKRWKNGELVYKNGKPIKDYNTWKRLIRQYKGLDIDNDITYDYQSFYYQNPEEAWDILRGAPDAHFSDRYKTVYHPTFSDESIYSDKIDFRYNPRGIVGGHWEENPDVFIPSPSKRDMDSLRETADYISVAEPNGLQIRDEYGRYPRIDGTLFGGVLPTVSNSYPFPKYADGKDSIHINPRKYTKGKDDEPIEAVSATGGDGVFNSSYLPGIDVVGRQLYPVVTRNFDGDIIGAKFTGERKNLGNTFDPNSQTIVSPQDFTKYRLSLARQNDANHTHAFANTIQNFMTGIMLGADAPLAAVSGMVGSAFGETVDEKLGGNGTIGSILGGFGLGIPAAVVSPPTTLATSRNVALTPRSLLQEDLKKAIRDTYNKTNFRSGVRGTTESVSPVVRTRVGDVETDNPNLFYRVGTKEIVDDFNKTGIVRAGEKNSQTGTNFVTNSGRSFTFKKDTYNNPMFKEGSLWYQPSEELNGLLVSNGRMQYAGKHSNPISYDSFGRRIPAEKLNSSNTSAYMWEPGYGYRRVFAKETPTAEWPTSRVAPRITPENAASITPEQWTAAQDAAIARGDMVEAQRLRDLHFTAKASSPILDSGNKPLKTYHTVSKYHDPSFNHFDTNIEGFHTGIFTTDNPIMSGSYMDKVVSKNEQDAIIEAIRQRELHRYDNYIGDEFNNLKEYVRKVYGNPKKARKEILKDFPYLKDIEEGRQKELYITLDNPLIIEGNNTGWNKIPISALPENMLSYPVVTPGAMGKFTSTRTIDKILGGYPETLPKVPYDGAVFKDIFDYGPNKFVSPKFNKVGNVYDVQNPNQVKLADAVTYDDKGIRIPLGKRDNFKINDIRYSWLAPFLGLGILGTLKPRNKQKKNTENEL